MHLPGIWGHYSITLDDKGRFSLPAKLKSQLEGDTLVLTKGIEQCLWFFEPDKWEKVATSLMSNSSIHNLNSQDVMRRIIAPAEEVVLDKSGRVKLPLPIMKSAALIKECYLIGMGDRVELWDVDTYEKVEQERNENVRQTWQAIGEPSLSGGDQ